MKKSAKECEIVGALYITHDQSNFSSYDDRSYDILFQRRPYYLVPWIIANTFQSSTNLVETIYLLGLNTVSYLLLASYLLRNLRTYIYLLKSKYLPSYFILAFYTDKTKNKMFEHKENQSDSF